MKIGLSSLLFVKASLEDAIKGIAEVGADYIEIICDLPHFMPDFDLAELKKLKELLDSCRLGVSIHSTFWDLNPASHYSEIRKLATTVHQKKHRRLRHPRRKNCRDTPWALPGHGVRASDRDGQELVS